MPEGQVLDILNLPAGPLNSDDFNCYSLFWTNVFNNDPLIFLLLINNYLTIGTINNATLFFTCFSSPLNITHEYLW